MPNRYSSIEIETVLVKLRFHFTSQKGSHKKFKTDTGQICILPANRKEIPVGTFRSILKQMQITNEEFKDLLNTK